MVFEDRNRVSSGDATRHPELAIVMWAVENLSPAQRARSVTYTSGEHSSMCSAAHAWVGLGRIVYAGSTAQLGQWRSEWKVPASGDVAGARAAISAGADLEARDRLGRTPLVAATTNRDAALAIALLDAGADPTIGDADGVTPRQHAVAHGQTALVAEFDRARWPSPAASHVEQFQSDRQESHGTFQVEGVDEAVDDWADH